MDGAPGGLVLGVAGGGELAGQHAGVDEPGPDPGAELEDQQVVLSGLDGAMEPVEHGPHQAVVDVLPVAGDQLVRHTPLVV